LFQLRDLVYESFSLTYPIFPANHALVPLNRKESPAALVPIQPAHRIIHSLPYFRVFLSPPPSALCPDMSRLVPPFPLLAASIPPHCALPYALFLSQELFRLSLQLFFFFFLRYLLQFSPIVPPFKISPAVQLVFRSRVLFYLNCG